jgi:ADP-ribose pyrophosphatase YjhB (NUDIX family)
MKKRHKNIPASYFTCIKDNKILLLRRLNTSYEDGNYSLVAGHVEAGETFTDCVIREAREEVGIILVAKDLHVFHIMHRNSILADKTRNEERVDVFFIADKWKGDIRNNEPDKCNDLSWFDINNLPSNTIPYIRQVINLGLLKKIFYSEYGWSNSKCTKDLII